MQAWLAVLALAGPPSGGELRWRAPAECPDRAAMADRIAAAGGSGELVVDGVVTRLGDDAWQLDLSLSLDGERDTRVLNATDCGALADAAVVLIAVRVDLAGVPAPPEPEPEPPAEPLPAPADDHDHDHDHDHDYDGPAEADLGLPTGVVIAVGGGISVGAMPLPGGPIDVGIGYAMRRVRFGVRGRWHVPRRVDLDTGQGALLQQGVGQVEVCARPAVRRLEIPICGEAALGGSRSDARGPGARDRAGLWAEAGVEGGPALHLTPRWALAARIGAAAVIAGTRYTLAGHEIFKPAPVTGRVLFLVEWTLPGRRRNNP